MIQHEPATLDDPDGWRILQDRVRSGRRELVVEADDPSRFAELYPSHGWRLEELPLEEIFIEMVRKPLGGGPQSR